MRLNLSLIILILSIIPFQSFSQQGDFQDLKSDILNAKSDQEKMERIIILGMNYGREFPDSLHYYSDSLMSSGFQEPQLATAGQTFLEGVENYNRGNLQEAIEKFEVSSAQFNAQENTNLFLRSQNLLGISYLRIGSAEEAINIFEDIITIATPEAAEHQSALLAAHGNVSNAYKRLGQYAQAIYHIEESMQYADSTRKNMSLNFSYLNMGQMLVDLELYERALNAFSMVNENQMAGTSMLAAFYNNKALVNERMDQNDSAAHYYAKTLEMDDSPQVLNQKVRPATFLAFYYADNSEFEKSAHYLELANNYCDDFCPEPAKLRILQAAIRHYRKQEQFEKALTFAAEFESRINELGMVHLNMNGFEEIASLYEQMGEMDKALEYQKIHNELNSRSNEQTRAIRISEQQAMLNQLEAERELSKAQETSSFYQRLSLNQWIAGVVLLAIAGAFYKYYRREKEDRALKEGELSKLQEEIKDLQANTIEEQSVSEFLTLKSKAVLRLDRIRYIKSDGPYIEVFTEEKSRPEIDRNTLKGILAELPDKIFIQVHRSYIVNINFIQAIYASKLVLKDGTELNVSRTFKSKVEEALKL
ncbi:LytTR family transcriptional regulator DNA-binding domain-containing protein [Roseivirga pacifica]